MTNMALPYNVDSQPRQDQMLEIWAGKSSPRIDRGTTPAFSCLSAGEPSTIRADVQIHIDILKFLEI